MNEPQPGTTYEEYRQSVAAQSQRDRERFIGIDSDPEPYRDAGYVYSGTLYSGTFYPRPQFVRVILNVEMRGPSGYSCWTVAQ